MSEQAKRRAEILIALGCVTDALEAIRKGLQGLDTPPETWERQPERLFQDAANGLVTGVVHLGFELPDYEVKSRTS